MRPSRPRCQCLDGLARALGLAVVTGLAACAGGEKAPPAEPPQAAALPPAPELPRGVTLLGMSAGNARDLLGEPSLLRDEQRAQYWRYSFSGCELDLYLYRDPTTGFDRVTHVELRGHAFPAPDQGCQHLEARLGGRPASGLEALWRSLAGS